MSTQVLTNKVGPCDGSGGFVRDMNINGITRIAKISVRHDRVIDAPTMHFQRNGHEESTELLMLLLCIFYATAPVVGLLLMLLRGY